MKTFGKWYSSVNESLAEQAEVAKEEVIKEVDAILASLEELSTQLKEEHDLVDPALNESLIVENADEIKAVLDADPLLALLKVGVLTTVATVGGAAYTIKTAKKHKKIRENMEADYAKLKQYKMELAKSEVTKAQLELKRQELNEDSSLDEVSSAKSKANKSFVDGALRGFEKQKEKLQQQIDGLRKMKADVAAEAKPKMQAKIDKLKASLDQVKSNIAKIKDKPASKDDAPKVDAPQSDAPKTDAPKTDAPKGDTPPAEEKPDKSKEKKVDMKKKLDNQIEDMKVRIEQLEAPVKEFEASLEQKYSEDKLSTTMGGQGGKSKELKAHLIDDITVSVAEYKLKALGSDMEKSIKKETEDRIQDAQKRQKKRLKKIKDEQEKNLEKVKEDNPEKVGEIDKALADEKEKKDSEGGDSEGGEEGPKSGGALDTDAGSDLTSQSTDEEPKEDEPKEEPVDKTDNSKEGQTKRIDAIIKRAEESGDEEKLKKAKDLKARILAKEAWQIEGTKLGLMLEAELKKLEMSEMIKESLSIKDRFSKLI